MYEEVSIPSPAATPRRCGVSVRRQSGRCATARRPAAAFPSGQLFFKIRRARLFKKETEITVMNPNRPPNVVQIEN